MRARVYISEQELTVAMQLCRDWLEASKSQPVERVRMAKGFIEAVRMTLDHVSSLEYEIVGVNDG